MKKNPDVKSTGEPATGARREFLHKAAKVGIATPAAVTLMLAAENKRAPDPRVSDFNREC